MSDAAEDWEFLCSKVLDAATAYVEIRGRWSRLPRKQLRGSVGKMMVAGMHERYVELEELVKAMNLGR